MFRVVRGYILHIHVTAQTALDRQTDIFPSAVVKEKKQRKQIDEAFVPYI